MDEMDDKTNASNGNESQGARKMDSARETKENVKEKVAKGVAAVAGALKGFSEQAEKEGLGRTTKDALHKAGETTREVAGTAKKEFERTKDHLKQRPGASTMTGDAGPQQGLGGSSMGTDTTRSTTDVPDLRKTDLGKSDEDLGS